jgi:hypothetical protein
MDVLKEKLKYSKLSDYFPEFTGPNEFEPAADFMKKQFIAVRKTLAKEI